MKQRLKKLQKQLKKELKDNTEDNTEDNIDVLTMNNTLANSNGNGNNTVISLSDGITNSDDNNVNDNNNSTNNVVQSHKESESNDGQDGNIPNGTTRTNSGSNTQNVTDNNNNTNVITNASSISSISSAINTSTTTTTTTTTATTSAAKQQEFDLEFASFDYDPAPVDVEWQAVDMIGKATNTVIQKDQQLTQITIATCPRYGDKGLPTSPCVDGIAQMYAEVLDAFKKKKFTDYGILKNDPSQHVRTVTITSQRNENKFAVQVDDRIYGPFSRIKVQPMIDIITKRQVAMPVKTFFPVQQM